MIDRIYGNRFGVAKTRQEMRRRKRVVMSAQLVPCRAGLAEILEENTKVTKRIIKRKNSAEFDPKNRHFMNPIGTTKEPVSDFPEFQFDDLNVFREFGSKFAGQVEKMKQGVPLVVTSEMLELAKKIAEKPQPSGDSIEEWASVLAGDLFDHED